MLCEVIGLLLLYQICFVHLQYFHPGEFGPVGFGYYPNSFGHGYFHSLKAYPPLPKKKFTIADELKYGPKFNPRPFPKHNGRGVYGFPGFPGFLPDEEGFSTTLAQSDTQALQGSLGSSSGNRSMAQVPASVPMASGGSASSTTTPVPSGATTEDEDKVVAGAPDQDCPSGQMRTGGECRDVA